jgi:hypothetical protein
MARLTNGIFGGLTGKAGDFEGYIRNGVPYIRAKRRKTKNAPTVGIKKTRHAMAVVNRFVGSMTEFVRVGFELTARGQTFSANNAAKSYQLLHALTGEYPDLAIDYAKVRVTQGSLPMPENLFAVRFTDAISFNWDVDSNAKAILSRSQTMLLAHCPVLNRCVFQIGGAARYRGSDLLDLPGEFQPHELQVYAGFVTDDHQQISNSVWLGAFAG